MSKFDKTDKTEGMEGSLGGTSAAEGAQLSTTGECKLKRTASNADLDVDGRPRPSRRNKSNNGQRQPCIESAQAALPEEDGAAAAEQPGDDGPPSPPASRTRPRASHNAAGRGDDPVVAMEVDGASKTMEKNTSPEAAGERSAEHRVGSEDVTDAAALDAVAPGEETTEETLWEQEDSSNEELTGKTCGCGKDASSVWHATGDVERENPPYACPECEKTKCPTKENRTCPADNAGPSPSPSGSVPARRRPRGFSSYRGQAKESEKVYLDEGPGVTPIADPRYIPQEWNKMLFVEMADQSMVKRHGRRTYHDFRGPTRVVKQVNRMLDYFRNHHPDEDLRAFAEEFFSANPEQAQARELLCANCGEVVVCANTNGDGLAYCRPVRHAIGTRGNGGGCRRRHERCPCGVTVEDKRGCLVAFRLHMKGCAFARNAPAVRRWARANPTATFISKAGIEGDREKKEANHLHKWIRDTLGLSTAATTEVKKLALIAVLKEERLTGYL